LADEGITIYYVVSVFDMSITARLFDGVRRLATYDVSPEFSVKVRRAALSPLGVLVFAAAIAILCGLALHPRVFALAGGWVPSLRRAFAGRGSPPAAFGPCSASTGRGGPRVPKSG